ncbi:putative integral membrane protein [Rosellinia necatrix]|uniref:Putative integral membrane protein n=1 Tax=Rosellinia necatrix TaxID=77044 RepID=A0A1W2TBA8_ROSNE|nr:putative integral membrane protein [Rosellinia necatrix]
MTAYFGVVLNAVNWTLTALAAVFLGLRVYCKLSRGRGLWWDDYILIAAFVSTLTAVAFITSSIMLGFANPEAVIGPAAARQLQIHGGVQNVLFSLGSDLSKTSFGFTLIRVTEGRMKQLVIFLIITLNIVYFLTIIFTFLKCQPAIYSWLPADTCWSLWTYIKFAIFGGVYSALVDFIFAIVPWFLVKDLNMKRTEKLGVAIAMSFGAIAGITAVVRTIFLPALASPNFSTKATTLVIWYTAEAATTIVAASIPVLRALIKELHTSGARYFSGEKYASGRQEGSGVRGSAKNHSKGNASKKGDSALHTSRVVTTVTGHGSKYPYDVHGDTGSDKSILEATAEPGKIMQTQEVRLSYHDRSDNDSMGYEMDVMGRRSS